MRRFRFIGDPIMFDWDVKPVFGDIYPETHFGTRKGVPFAPVFEAGVDTNHWQEVFDHIGRPTPKPLHKDTDLGYYAGLAMQTMMLRIDEDALRLSDPQKIECAILFALELIKQLDGIEPYIHPKS